MRELPDPYVLAFLLVVGITLLLSYSRLLAAVRGSVSCFRGLNGTLEMLGNQYVCNAVRVIFLLLIPFYALTLTITGLSRVDYGWTLAALVVLYLFRKLVFALAGWISSRPAAFRQVERTGYMIGILVLLVSLSALLLGWLVPAAPQWLLWTLLALPAGTGLVFYFRRGLSLLLQAEFSPFFWVLYLCALEILPICVVVNRLINGN